MPLVRLVRSALLAPLFVFAALSLSSASALARPPHVPLDAPRAYSPEIMRSAGLYSIPPSVKAALHRFGGARAVRVAQGVPAGKYVALRPMFWITRDQRGAMFALGGLF
jgi:hypothetical protein